MGFASSSRPQAKLRMVVDVRFPTSQIVPTQWPMPYVEDVQSKLRNASCFALLDAFKGYWQFPTTPRCSELYSFWTPFGVFTPRRIIMGAANAVKAFQSGMEKVLDIHNHQDALLWVDDILGNACDPEVLVRKVLRRIFERLRIAKVKLSVKKCSLFQLRVVWCGREISQRGITFDPAYVQGLREMSEPSSVADL